MRYGIGIGLALSAALAFASPAWGWSEQTHMAIGAIAYDDLAKGDRQAIAAIEALMAHHPDHARFERSLAGLTGAARTRRMFELMARWPDDIRSTAWTHPKWHYSGVVVRGWTRLFPFTVGEADTAFPAQLAIARDPRANAADRAIAWCWIFHITGDMHQPLHAGHRMDGGFPLTDHLGTWGFFRRVPGGQPTDYHQYWDRIVSRDGTTLAEHAADSSAQAVRAERVVVPQLPADRMADTTARYTAWVGESRYLARTYGYGPDLPEEADDAARAVVTPPAFARRARSVAWLRIAQAGHRLAVLIAGR